MPMIPEAVIAMLLVVELEQFTLLSLVVLLQMNLQVELMTRKAKLLVTASCGYEPGRTVHYKPLVNKALELANHKPNKCIIFQRDKDKAELNLQNDIQLG